MARFSPEESKSIRSAVASFNAKRQRLIAKGVDESLIPAKQYASTLKATYQSKAALNRRIRQLEKLTSRGTTEKSKGGVVGTDALFDFMQNELRLSRNALKREQRRLESSASNYISMHSENIANTRAKINFLTGKSLRNASRSQIQSIRRNALTSEEKTAQARKLEQNLYDAFVKEIATSDLSEEEKKKLKSQIWDVIRSMSGDDILKAYENSPTLKAIFDHYRDIDTGQIDSLTEILRIAADRLPQIAEFLGE